MLAKKPNITQNLGMKNNEKDNISLNTQAAKPTISVNTKK